MRLTLLATMLLLCASAAYGFYSELNGLTCPENNQPFAQAIIASDCRLYVFCEKGELIMKPCLRGQAFNTETSSCEDRSTFNCYDNVRNDLRHPHKRSVEEYHTINIQAVKDKMVELYNNIKPQVISAAKEVAPSFYGKFETDYLPFIKTVKLEVMPFFYAKVLPQIQKGRVYAKRYASRLIEKVYKSYELSNSTHITIVSMSDLANDVTNDLEPVIRLGRFLSATLLQPRRAKRSVEIQNAYNYVWNKYRTHGNPIISKIILPIIDEMIKDPETKTDLSRLYSTTLTACSPIFWEMMKLQAVNSPEGMVINIPKHVFDSAVQKLKTEIEPIFQRIVKQQFINAMRIVSKNMPIIMESLDSMNFDEERYALYLKYQIVSILYKYKNMYEFSNLSYIKADAFTEIQEDFMRIRIYLSRIIDDYLSKNNNIKNGGYTYKILKMFFGKDYP